MFEEKKVISINLNKLYNPKTSDIYEITRKAWALNPNRANKADFVFAEFKGEIIDIFKINKSIGWKECYSNSSRKRYYFEKEEVLDKSIKQYIGKKIVKKRGASNPIHYFNC